MFLADFFRGTPYSVEVEKDLSIQQQFLDVVVVRKSPGLLLKALPDGLNNMSVHNLLSFKSYRATLNRWTIDELTGHYVSYRKLVRSVGKKLFPEGDFRLYAVCVRFPKKLAKLGGLRELSPGVFEVPWTEGRMRILVISRMPQSDANSIFQLFSGDRERVVDAQKKFKLQSKLTSSLVLQLLEKYRTEGTIMPYTLEDFDRDFKRSFVSKLTPAERVADLSPEERLRGLPAEDRLEGLSADELRKVAETAMRLAKKHATPRKKSS